MITNTTQAVTCLLTRRMTPTAPLLAETTPPPPWRNLPHVLTMEGAEGARVLVITAHDGQLARYSVTVAFTPSDPHWSVEVLVEPQPTAREAARLLAVLEDALLTCWRHHMAEGGAHPLRSALFGQAASRLAAYIDDTREAARTDDDPAGDRETTAELMGDAIRARLEVEWTAGVLELERTGQPRIAPPPAAPTRPTRAERRHDRYVRLRDRRRAEADVDVDELASSR